jgi:hypothetical protein
MSLACEIFERGIEWLRASYASHTFYCERDLVFVLQRRLIDDVITESAALEVFNDFPMLPGTRRSLCADLAIVSDSAIEVVAEFKYEPSHSRVDIPSSKFPLVFWGREGVAKDIERLTTFVTDGAALVAHSFFIDEGGAFRHRPAHPNSEWLHWGDNTYVLHSVACREIPSSTVDGLDVATNRSTWPITGR